MEAMHSNILTSLKTAIKAAEIDAFVIPSNDEFQNEYVPDHLNRLKYITGFSGSNGVAIISTSRDVFFTDGRYLFEATKQLGNHYTVLDMGNKNSCDWFDLGLKKGSVLGYDPMLHSQTNLAYYERLGTKYGFTMKPCMNLVDIIWKRDPESIKPAFKLDIKHTGLDYADKCKLVIDKMDNKAEALLITTSDSICWLLNIRGADIEYTPFLLSFAILNRNGTVHLFTDPSKINFKLPKVTVHPLNELTEELNKPTQVDFAKSPVKFLQILGDKSINGSNPIELLKACKNSTEIKGIRLAHLNDGVALTKFMYWLSKKASVTELEAADKLLELRQKSKLFVYPSFATISAYGPNASIIHYKPTKESDTLIGKDNFYLLDSGGQYFNGTTDVTRTLHLGKPTKKQKHLFTLVLKGHINLAGLRFPRGTTGAHLDAIARQALWQEGLDFAHGTGHGVGHFLSVHEGPQSISKSLSNRIPLESGMVLSNEPGFYENGRFGIRIESLLLVKESSHHGYLEFETLTLAPIQSNLIDYKLLNNAQLKWLTAYNKKVLSRLRHKLTEAEFKWILR